MFLKKTVNSLIITFLICLGFTSEFVYAGQDYVINANFKINEVGTAQIKPGINTALAIPYFIKEDTSIKYGISIDMLGWVTVNGISGVAVDGVPNLYIATGYRDSSGDHYLPDPDDTTVLFFPMDLNPVPIVATLFTKGKKMPAPGSYVLSQHLGITRVGERATGNLYLQGTFTVTASTCSVTTNKNISINWPSVSVTDIKNGIATEKTAPVMVDCEDDGENPVMDIYLSSSNGSADTAGGIINTSTDNLGLKLTWQDGGAAIPLKTTFQISAPANGATKNLGIVAKPTATGTGNIAGGDFNTTLTMTIQYH